jgi:hypothetical protein
MYPYDRPDLLVTIHHSFMGAVLEACCPVIWGFGLPHWTAMGTKNFWGLFQYRHQYHLIYLQLKHKLSIFPLFTKAIFVWKFSTVSHIIVVHSIVEPEYLLQKFWHHSFHDTYFAKVLYVYECPWFNRIFSSHAMTSRFEIQNTLVRSHVALYTGRKDEATLRWLTLCYQAWSSICLNKRLKIHSVKCSRMLHYSPSQLRNETAVHFSDSLVTT